MTNTTREPKSFPMPLWLQGIVEALAAAFVSAGVIVVPLGIMWLTGAFARLPLADAGALGAYVWLTSFGVPLELISPETQELIGTWWFIPLGLLLGWLLLARRTGSRLAKASQLKTLWQPTLGALAAFAFFVWGTITLVSHDVVVIHQGLAIALPTLVFGLGYAWGALGYYRIPLTQAITRQVDTLSDALRHTLHYAWALLRAGIMAFAGAWAIAAMLVTVQLGMHWAAITDVYQRLDAGIQGDLIITVLQILILPNLVAWTMSYLTGAGFNIGLLEVSPAGTLDAAHPALPILAAIPEQQNLTDHWWVLGLLAVAGAVAGWWFFSTGENHLEDLVIAKIPHHATALTLGIVATGATIGLAGGLLCYLVLLCAGGSWALGTLSSIGAPALTAAALFAAHTGIGAAIGYALAPLRHGIMYYRMKQA